MYDVNKIKTEFIKSSSDNLKMKVIFLDVDGVLNSDEYFEKINNLNVNGIEKEVDVLLMHEKNDMSKYFAPNRGTAL